MRDSLNSLEYIDANAMLLQGGFTSWQIVHLDGHMSWRKECLFGPISETELVLLGGHDSDEMEHTKDVWVHDTITGTTTKRPWGSTEPTVETISNQHHWVLCEGKIATLAILDEEELQVVSYTKGTEKLQKHK